MTLTVPKPAIAYLDEVDKQIKPIDEYHVFSELLKAIGPIEQYLADDRKGIFAEVAAFQFQRADSEQRKVWGIYWTEFSSGTSANGRWHLPEIAQVDFEVITHWISRAEQFKHPVLKARYADLAWEIGKYLQRNIKNEIVAGASLEPITIPHNLIQIAIASYLDGITNNLYPDDYTTWQVISRALQLAISTKNSQGILKLKDFILSYNKLHQSDQQYMWWYFDDLTSMHAKSLNFTAAENEEIIQTLISALKKFSAYSTDSFDPHQSLNVAQRLGARLDTYNDKEKIKDVIKEGCKAFETAAENAGGMLAIAWLEDLIPIYRQQGLIADATRIENLIRSRAGEAHDEMASFEISYEIDKKDMEDWVKSILGQDSKEALSNIALRFLIRESTTKDSLLNSTKDSPLTAMIGSSIINNDGFTVAKVGSIEDDLEGRIIHHTTTLVKLHSIWLFKAYEGAKTKYSLNSDEIIDYIKHCELFDTNREVLLKEGIEAWINGDAFKCLHIIVPQIEAALRNLLIGLGGSVMITDPNNSGAFQTIGFGKIINHKVFIDKVPSDIRFHLKALYSDQRGLNLRNDIAHGLINVNLLNMTVADWVVHTLLLIGCMKIEHK